MMDQPAGIAISHEGLPRLESVHHRNSATGNIETFSVTQCKSPFGYSTKQHTMNNHNLKNERSNAWASRYGNFPWMDPWINNSRRPCLLCGALFYPSPHMPTFSVCDSCVSFHNSMYAGKESEIVEEKSMPLLYKENEFLKEKCMSKAIHGSNTRPVMIGKENGVPEEKYMTLSKPIHEEKTRPVTSIETCLFCLGEFVCYEDGSSSVCQSCEWRSLLQARCKERLRQADLRNSSSSVKTEDVYTEDDARVPSLSPSVGLDSHSPGFGLNTSPTSPVYSQKSSPMSPVYGQKSTPVSPVYGKKSSMSPVYGKKSTPMSSVHGQKSTPMSSVHGQKSTPMSSVHGQKSTPMSPVLGPNPLPRRSLAKDKCPDCHRVLRANHKCTKCDVCGKVLTTVATFKNHYRLHTGEKPFECSVCKKRFAQRQTMKNHEKKHMDGTLDVTHRLTMKYHEAKQQDGTEDISPLSRKFSVSMVGKDLANSELPNGERSLSGSSQSDGGQCRLIEEQPTANKGQAPPVKGHSIDAIWYAESGCVIEEPSQCLEAELISAKEEKHQDNVPAVTPLSRRSSVSMVDADLANTGLPMEERSSSDVLQSDEEQCRLVMEQPTANKGQVSLVKGHSMDAIWYAESACIIKEPSLCLEAELISTKEQLSQDKEHTRANSNHHSPVKDQLIENENQHTEIKEQLMEVVEKVSIVFQDEEEEETLHKQTLIADVQNSVTLPDGEVTIEDDMASDSLECDMNQEDCEKRLGACAMDEISLNMDAAVDQSSFAAPVVQLLHEEETGDLELADRIKLGRRRCKPSSSGEDPAVDSKKNCGRNGTLIDKTKLQNLRHMVSVNKKVKKGRVKVCS